MQLTQFIGDSKFFSLPLAWGGEPFDADAGWSLIFTAKHSAGDNDSSAVIQKASGAGVTSSGATAMVEIVPQDTILLPSTQLIWDIQAQNLTSGEVRTVAFGGLKLTRDVTRSTTTSLPIFTHQPGIPVAGKSAYDIAVDNGFSGSESQWLSSLVGPTGPIGPQGDIGPAGTPAPTYTFYIQDDDLYMSY